MSERNRKLENSTYKEAKASPSFLFWKTFNSWQRLIRESLEPLGSTQVRYSILAATSYLESAEHVTQQNVSDQLSMDKMIVSDVVKTLEKRNFLTRNPHSGPESRRHVQRDFHQARHQIHRQSRVVAPLTDSGATGS